jgi:hypothetical protein
MHVVVRNRDLVSKALRCDTALRHVEASKANSLSIQVSGCPSLRIFLGSMLKE